MSGAYPGEQGETAEPGAKRRIRLGRNYWRLWSASVVSNLGDGVGLVAYPWLASAVTRNALLLAGISVVQRIPWLVFTLPAGVITDRADRRKLILNMHLVAFGVTLLVALAVLAGQSDLPGPDEIESGAFRTGPAVYLAVLYLSALLFGFAEVLRDNASQTILPAIVEPDHLEKANGNLWAAEFVTNSFIGPPLGGLLVGVGFAVPFFFDAGSFALAAGLVFLVTGTFRAIEAPREKVAWRDEIMDGVRWLWRHHLLRSLAIILGLLNGLGMVGFATFVFFAQEVLDIGATTFGILMTGVAFGGVLGGVLAPRVSKRLGSGPSLYLAIVVSGVTSGVIGVASQWPVVWLMGLIGVFFGVVWNVITVSLRQTIIPDELLGRVNSVYRLLGWGAIPIGAVVGGLVVAVTEWFGSRELALRMPWLLTAVAYAVVFLYAAPRLTTAKIESARAGGQARREAAGG